MTLPANDAFTLALAHSNESSMPSRRRSLTRSPSPKIPFSQSTDSPKRRPGARRRVSKGSVSSGVEGSMNGGSTLQEIDEKEDSAEVERKLLPEREQQTETKKVVAEEKKKIDWEIPRKTLHSSIGFFTLYLYASKGSPQTVIYYLSAALAVIVPCDVLRLNWPAFERTYERVCGFLMRESEKKTTNGVIWYIIGVIFVLSLYPLDVAIISIMILSWADTSASTFGRLWGRYTPPLPARILGIPLAPRKSLAGFIAAALTGTTIVYGFWTLLDAGIEEPSWSWDQGVMGAGVDNSIVGTTVKGWLREQGFKGVSTGGWAGLAVVSVASGLATALAEAVDLGSLDDNLTLPIMSGAAVWGLLKLLSWVSA